MPDDAFSVRDQENVQIVRPDSRVLTVASLYALTEHLPALASGKLLAIRVSGAMSEEECAIHVAAIDKLELSPYAQEHRLLHGGPTVYDYEARMRSAFEYFSLGSEWNPIFRESLRPHASIADRVAAILGETHASGIVAEPLYPGMVPSMFVIRRFGEGACAEPHVDRTEFDWPALIGHYKPPSALFSFLAYPEVAEQGGAIVVFPKRIRHKKDWEAARNPRSAYALDRNKLPSNPAKIVPERGDVIVFNAHNVHEVEKIVRGRRSTVSFFGAWRGETRPIGRYA